MIQEYVARCKFTNEAGQVARTLTAANFIEGEDIQRFQHGTRIELWRIKKFKAKFGSRHWKAKFLETKGFIDSGEAVDLKEITLLDIINSPTASIKSKRLAEIELNNYRETELPQRGYTRLLNKLNRLKN